MTTRTAFALYDRRTGRRVGMSIAGITRRHAQQTLQALHDRDARGRRPDLHDLIPHLGVVQLTEQTWGSQPGDTITSGSYALSEEEI